MIKQTIKQIHENNSMDAAMETLALPDGPTGGSRYVQ